MLTICPNDQSKLVKFEEDEWQGVKWQGVKCKLCEFKMSKKIERKIGK